MGVPSGETPVARRPKHRGLLKQILCSGREVIPLIGLGERKRVQVRKHRDPWRRGGRESRFSVCTIARELGDDKERADYLFSVRVVRVVGTDGENSK